ncbi:TRAP transporter substrate-binding protein DctP [Lonepinella koalarum]|uniref:TRAP transporter substrate-binding protein DctP n=1 Tax=Lonepinella koalarum TaxID=53417 RepID=UPI003F6DF94B
MKKAIYLLLVIVIGSIFAIHKDNQSYLQPKNGTITLRMSQVSSEKGAIGQGMEKFAQLIHERTQGRYAIQTFHNGQLGGERDGLENIQMGILDLTVVNQSVLSNFIPEISALDIPYMITGSQHADNIFLGEIGDHYLKELDKVGLKGLTIWESGFRNLTNSKKDVNTVADVKALRIRTMENKIHQEFWRTLNTDPVPMAWSEAYTAMQQGAIDGQENPILVILTNNVGLVNKHLAITEHVYSTVFIIMSPKLWDHLSDEDKQIFTTTAREVAIYERELNRSLEHDALEKLKAVGVTVTYPNKEEFIKMSEPFRNGFEVKYADMFKQIRAVIPNK